jgi:predicted transcriptional regulator
MCDNIKLRKRNKSEVKGMFNEKNFRRAIEDAGLTIKDIADLLGINIVTLYRKINGDSDFYREEIRKVGEVVGSDKILSIFFDTKVA